MVGISQPSDAIIVRAGHIAQGFAYVLHPFRAPSLNLNVELTNKTVVVVDITVNEEGAVTSASARGSASSVIRRKCEQSALQARWSKKRGAGDTRGTITFTITPR